MGLGGARIPHKSAKETRTGGGDLVRVLVGAALRRGQWPVAGDRAEDVHLGPGIGRPGRSGVPEVVAAQVSAAEFGDGFVPVRGVARDGGGVASGRSGR
ncbi:hypothetical protein [Streptomyces fuscigenes]|uniref:hypothetical protein n=1 Tax=Streptomyces fuscigenes TaxID=1528880 RepID=UPI001F209B53|nr:hypothetical protein [Streptomyces fuscigenes]MCF3963532.1 hypothetical protein [Streptomyces fuscigenes]